MSDRGLGEANREAAVVSALARCRDITPPSTSNRLRASAAPAPSSDAATDAGRACVRPDLHNEHSGMTADVDEVDAARGREYALLSLLLARAPDRSLLERLADLRGDASPLGVAHAALAQAAGRTSAERVEREYFDLFIVLGRGRLLPYG